MKLCYKCHYDGFKCDKATPRFEGNELIPESNAMIKERYKDKISERSLDYGWDHCDSCERNCSMGGTCYGVLVVEEGGTIETLKKRRPEE